MTMFTSLKSNIRAWVIPLRIRCPTPFAGTEVKSERITNTYSIVNTYQTRYRTDHQPVPTALVALDSEMKPRTEEMIL